jgi:hypothetical protein
MCNNYIKTKDQKTVLELSRREAERKFNALFGYKYINKNDDFLDQILVTFSEFKIILQNKQNLLSQLLPNVYDYEKFFTYRTEHDFIIINEKSLPSFAKYCKGVLKDSTIKMEFLFPKIIIMKNRHISFKKSEETDDFQNSGNSIGNYTITSNKKY